jgi:bis(5'-nucleosyl)-tetraphosphatase (symmetrical)
LACYAIGDVQGCYEPLSELLRKIQFQAGTDHLWFAGDLVNRGPDSLAVLRFIKNLGSHASTVLGNHDLHCIAVASGVRNLSFGDTLQPILDAPDCSELIEWLCQQPVLHEAPQYPYIMVHAGIPPGWDLNTARNCARELESVLRGPKRLKFLRKMYGNKPKLWQHQLTGMKRLRYITNAFTRLRYCYADGRLDFAEKRPPGKQDPKLIPWYQVETRETQGIPIIFGHWASLQAEQALDPSHDVMHIDTGCVWGGPLTALRLEDQALFSVPGLNV